MKNMDEENFMPLKYTTMLSGHFAPPISRLFSSLGHILVILSVESALPIGGFWSSHRRNSLPIGQSLSSLVDNILKFTWFWAVMNEGVQCTLSTAFSFKICFGDSDQ